jgi:hypothetical protein
MGTDQNSAASGVSRRRLLQAGGALAGAAVVGVGGTQILGASRARAATGTIADLQHVVILMQENRSFDHYFGALPGVRGFADKQALAYQGGTSVFDQPDKSRTDLGYLLPFHMDSTKVDAQNAGDLDHSWSGDHSARNGGLWNDWVAAKTEQCMGYFTRADLPFNYALADAFTICDGYHQSILGPTSPGVHQRLRGRHAAAGVVDRRALRVLRAPFLKPQLRRALRRDRAQRDHEQRGPVGVDGAVHHLRRARRVLRPRAAAGAGDVRDQRVHQLAADRHGAAGADADLLAVDPARIRGLQHLRPHLDEPLPADLDRRPAGQRHADVAVNRSSFTVTATMSNAGSVGVSMFVFPDKYLTASATPFTVVSGTNRTYTWTATKKNKYGYAFSIYGPDGFVRSFAGDVVAAATTTGQIPVVTAAPVTGSSPSLLLTLANSGTTAVVYTLTVNDYAGTTQTVTVGAAGSAPLSWPVDANGYYDVIITANTSDGFTRRYAGRIA